MMSIFLSFNELAEFIVLITSHSASLVPVKLCISFHLHIGSMITESECQENKKEEVGPEWVAW